MARKAKSPKAPVKKTQAKAAKTKNPKRLGTDKVKEASAESPNSTKVEWDGIKIAKVCIKILSYTASPESFLPLPVLWDYSQIKTCEVVDLRSSDVVPPLLLNFTQDAQDQSGM